ncbi:MAG: 50S ribosomal protein L11 methyltransferase [Bacteroidales bacterium]|nr:50S ribosomal protein L11 methyltransferase [Bacteroidales bacterium]
MDYIEVTITGFRDLDSEIAMARLAAMGFESFSEVSDGFSAYIQDDQFDEKAMHSWLTALQEDQGVQYQVVKIPRRNWNEEWERAYDPVVVEGKCLVRAPFHKPADGMLYDIVIEPKMSFGTAHHATTALMIGLMMEEKLTGSTVLDMGCGTGVLAILASKMGASKVLAVDNDEWAYQNALENVEKNGCRGVTVLLGDITAVALSQFDLIAANINRNVLLNDIPAYAEILKPGGRLLMSGFYEEDIPQITEAAELAGLRHCLTKTMDRWTGIKFIK